MTGPAAVGNRDGGVALVTGGATGIGLAISERLGGEGMRVIIASRNVDHHTEGLARLHAAGIDARAHIVDVKNHESVEDFVAHLESSGTLPDVLVNNASANFVCPAVDLTYGGWKTIQETVLWGPWFLSTAIARRWIDRSVRGVICNILSTVVISGAAGRAHSAAAKSGLHSLTKSLAVEWAEHGIRVVGVAPGPVETKGSAEHVWGGDASAPTFHDTPMARAGRSEEIAQAVAFLTSSQASYVSGETLVVDGATWLAGATYGSRNHS